MIICFTIYIPPNRYGDRDIYICLSCVLLFPQEHPAYFSMPTRTPGDIRGIRSQEAQKAERLMAEVFGREIKGLERGGWLLFSDCVGGITQRKGGGNCGGVMGSPGAGRWEVGGRFVNV